MALRGPRAYLGKVKKSQGVILGLSALKFKIKIRRAIWPPPPNLNRVKRQNADAHNNTVLVKDYSGENWNILYKCFFNLQ